MIGCCLSATLPGWNAQHESFKNAKQTTKALAANTAASAGSQLGTELRKDMVELFYKVDKDRNGWLSEEEAFGCLPPALCPDGESDDTIQWDPVDDDRITLVEW